MKRLKKIMLSLFIILFINGGIFLWVFFNIANPNKKDNNSEGEFQAYYQEINEDDILEEDGMYYVDSQILLTAVEDATFKNVESLIKEYKGKIVGYISTTNDYQIHLGKKTSYKELETIVKKWKKNSIVEDASIEYAAEMSFDAVDYKKDPWVDDDAPKDMSGSEWDASNPDGKNWWAEAIDMPDVWEKDIEYQPVKVGIIDGMFDINNADLDEGKFVKLWNNPEDKDGVCTVAELYNAATIQMNTDKQENNTEALESDAEELGKIYHGTHVAGIIAAQAENKHGIAGVSQNAELYGYSILSESAKVSADASWGFVFEYKCIIAKMLNEDVKIINISIGHLPEEDDSVRQTFMKINNNFLGSFLKKYIDAGKEFLIIKAAGNDEGADCSNDLFCGITDKTVADKIIVVGAADYDRDGYYTIADLSSVGERVDVFAPGVNILSDFPANVTASCDGTSMAAPIVSGLASLIWGINPSLNAKQVRDIILTSTSAHIFDLDKKNRISRWWINSKVDVTSIVNAKICVELAEKTKTVGVKKDSNKADFGTVTGTIYATSDDGEFEKVKISPVEIYDEQENLIKKLKVEDYAYEGSKTEPLITYQSYTDLLAPGKYIIKVKAAGCEEQEKEITIKAGEMKLIDFSFEKKKKLSNSIYVGAVLDAIEDTKNYNGSDGYGALYDIDGNGQDELIMVYTANMDTGAGYGFPAKVCSVYGISNGKPVALIYKEVLFVEAGGSSGYAAVVQSDGNVYFAITSENGETSSEPGYSSNRNGRWGLYTIDGESLKLDINVGYNYFFKDRIEYEKSTAVFNGRECSYKEYEMWKNNIEELFLIEPYKNNYVMRLGDLLAYLQEDMVENTSNLEESSPEIPANTDPPAEPENVLSDERILQILGERYKDIGILYEESGTDEMFEGFVGGYSLDPNVSPCMRRIKVNKKTGEVTEMDPIGTVLNTYFIE